MAKEKDTNFDVAVVGGGPAGMMAAGKAASKGFRVVLIEKNASLGKKLLLTGNGRCNLSNAEFNLRELAKNYNNGEFLFHAFSVFGPKEVIEFFDKLGVKTKIEKDGRVFPESDKVEEVLEALKRYLTENKVEILLNSEVVNVVKKAKKIEKIILKSREITAKKYILCAGGKSYPLTGSNGSGYKLAEKLGHTISDLMPALTPLKIKEQWVKDLQGISFKNVKINGELGEFIFTHSGISGPGIFNISAKVGDLLAKGLPAQAGEAKISFDFFPLLNQEELFKKIDEVLKRYAKKSAKNILSDFIPAKLSEVILDNLKIDKNKIANNMSKIEKRAIVKALKGLEVTAEDTFGFEQAMATRGGISLKEIDHKTMKSKLIDNLFFAGEIIDVDGKTGGFNLQACWSTGNLAGASTVEF